MTQPEDNRVVFGVVAVMACLTYLYAGVVSAQFTKVELDAKATYAIRMVEAKDGWQSRELLKLCAIKGGPVSGVNVEFAVIAKGKSCPK